MDPVALEVRETEADDVFELTPDDLDRVGGGRIGGGGTGSVVPE